MDSKERHRIWYLNNREQKLSQNKEWIEDNKEQYKATQKKWYKKNKDKLLNQSRTKSGVINAMYKHQVNRIKKKGFQPIGYTKEEFTEWILNKNKFHKLYDKWVKSKYDKKLKPSIDRIKDLESYTFNNIQILTWEENFRKGMEDRKNGTNPKGLTSVVQLDKFNNIIETYKSIALAASKLGVDRSSISSALRGKSKTCKGYVWKYK